MTNIPDEQVKIAVQAFLEISMMPQTPPHLAILFIHAARIIRELRPDLRFDP